MCHYINSSYTGNLTKALVPGTDDNMAVVFLELSVIKLVLDLEFVSDKVVPK